MLGVCFFIALIYNRFEVSQQTLRWIEPELTFGELGQRLHQRAMEDYEEMTTFASTWLKDDR